MKAVEPTDALRHAYGAVNRGEIDAALALMSPDVDWPNTVEGGRERGREAVRAYWTRLFGVLIPTFDPVCVREVEDGRIVVHAQLRFSDPASGKPLAHEHVRHVFTLRDSMIVRMDASEPKVLGPCPCGAAGCPQAARAM